MIALLHRETSKLFNISNRDRKNIFGWQPKIFGWNFSIFLSTIFSVCKLLLWLWLIYLTFKRFTVICWLLTITCWLFTSTEYILTLYYYFLPALTVVICLQTIIYMLLKITFWLCTIFCRLLAITCWLLTTFFSSNFQITLFQIKFVVLAQTLLKCWLGR